MSDERAELLPCPFCGGIDLFVEREDFTAAFVFCNSCSTRGPIECQESDNEETPGEANARRIWNTRTSPASRHGTPHNSGERLPIDKAESGAGDGVREAWRNDVPPSNGYIDVRSVTTYRWLAYSPKSDQWKRGIKGRWQSATEYGWANAGLPQNIEWRVNLPTPARASGTTEGQP